MVMSSIGDEGVLSRRSFLKWTALLGGSAAISSGLSGCGLTESEDVQDDVVTAETVWKTAACNYNCSNVGSRCLLRLGVVDGVPQQIVTDSEDGDEFGMLQRRACLRGRSQISNILSPDRIKYPMKRKGWSPDNPNGAMRGKDEWERISWDEAVEIFASETQKIVDTYGPRSVYVAAWTCDSPFTGVETFDAIPLLFRVLGGAMHNWGTVSLGSWPLVELLMTGSFFESPDLLARAESDLHFYFGCNWQANLAGNSAHELNLARKRGARIVIIDPWLNQTAQGVADEWVGVRPGTDTALVLGMAYHMIENNLQNQEYLDTYCVGFDAEHMPEGAPTADNFKDYVLGTYDHEPKTPAWASKICGVPESTITRLAEEIAQTEKVCFFAGCSTSKIQAGEMFSQALYTLAFMHGNIGSPGNYVSWLGRNENGYSFAPYCKAGNWVDAKGLNPLNPIDPPKIITNPDFSRITDKDSWDQLEFSETWQSILDGEYGRDIWPGGKKPVDIRMIYCGGYSNQLNSLCNANKGIELFRKVDFVATLNTHFCPSAQYADLVMPAASWWEKQELCWSQTSETVYWADRIMEPLYEARSESEIGRAIATAMGVDPNKIDTMTMAERTYHSLAGAIYSTDDKGTSKPLITITQADIDELGCEGTPQEGLVTVEEFKAKGCWKLSRTEGDALIHRPYAEYFEDPVANPLPTSTGKFEIYCAALPAIVNGLGFSTISPISKWQVNPIQGQGAQTEEYPLLLWTPHSLRRAHTNFDSVTSLREAYPQECFMSTVDAEARGIANGDPVLITSPHGKVLRPAKVLPTVVPGGIALQDGAWLNIDEETGIDIGGCPNILQAPTASGQGVQAYTGTLCQVEKYTGPIKLEADKRRALVLPTGIE